MTRSARQIPSSVILSERGESKDPLFLNGVILSEESEANKPKNLRLSFGTLQSPGTRCPIQAAPPAARVGHRYAPTSLSTNSKAPAVTIVLKGTTFLAQIMRIESNWVFNTARREQRPLGL
jgi:hypothetical protein